MAVTALAPPARPVAAPSRFTELDGLRGLAALVVVVHHALLTDPALASPYVGGVPGGLAGWLSYSPLHLLWAGGEAVLVFFVLSGFVLAGPALSWHYYPRRAIRLLLPTAAAVALALPQAVLWWHGSTGSWWLTAHSGAGTVSRALSAATLWPDGTWLVTPLWSLHWEALFSLALPAYLLLTRLRTPWQGAAAAAALIATTAYGGATDHRSLVYLPVFGLGVLVFRFRQQLTRPVPAAGLALLLAPWLLEQQHLQSAAWQGVSAACRSAGAVLVVAGALHLPWLRAGWLQWLGRRSFSLYLVHEPLVVSVAHLLGGRAPVLLVVAIALPLSLLVACAFHAVVEEPSRRLARRF